MNPIGVAVIGTGWCGGIRAETLAPPELPKTRMTLDELKRWYVNRALEETGGNKVRAAELLGIDRRTLYRILERDDAEG